MRRDHPTSPFDVEADEADDVTQQFWGSSRGWVSRRHSAFDDGSPADHLDERRSDDTTGSLDVIRDGVRAFRPRRTGRSTGHVARTRRHGVTAHGPAQTPARSDHRSDHRPGHGEASLGELAGGWHDDVDDPYLAGPPTQPLASIDHEPDLVPLSPAQSSTGIDPLLARVGILIVVGLLLVPIALVMRSRSEPTAVDALTAGEVPIVAAIDPTTGASAAPAPPPVDAAAGTSQSAPAASSGTADGSAGSEPATTQASDDQAATAAAVVDDEVQVAASTDAGVATVSAAAERIVPDCPATYVAGPGDSWYRIADAAGVTPNAVLDENLATVDTVIFPGDDICLPAGATMPTQPTTTTVEPASASTTAPTTTADTTAADTSAPAATEPATSAPATTEPPPAPASSAEVQQIIRDVWPDELEEKALQIAWRESNYRPDVYNGWCCYGVFQIYWSVHVSWLDEYGINSSSDLLDARKNITAAYALYQRAGGWGPWGG